MRWCAPGHETSFDALLARLEATAWPGPPEGFAFLTPPRPMRVVLTGQLGDHARVVVKWSRPDSLADKVSRRVRGGKGVREGTVLRALKHAGVRVPEALAYTDEGEDVLVTAHLADLVPLPPADEATPALIEDVAMLMAVAHAAGLRHDDVHAGNLALSGALPVLVDVGSARIGKPILPDERARVLAALAHGLLHGARRTQRLRALIAYLRQVEGGTGRAPAREVVRAIDEALRRLRRRFWRGRDRRATRDGRHFALFTTEMGLAGVRNLDTTDPAWIARAEGWLDDAEAGEPLKAGGRVRRVGEVVVKHYDGVTRGRLPRPVRAFRMAYALRNRGIPAPTPHVALSREGGGGIVVTDFVDAPNLHDMIADGRFAALTPETRRRFLAHVGRTLRHMHDAEVTHRDLKAPNLLVTGDPDGAGLRVTIADLDGARVRRGAVRWSRRERDLMRLDASLDLPDGERARILDAYHRVLPRPPQDLGTFADAVATLSRRKRGPSGRPR